MEWFMWGVIVFLLYGIYTRLGERGKCTRDRHGSDENK